MKQIILLGFFLASIQLLPGQQIGIIASSIQITGGGGGSPGLLDTVENASFAYSTRLLLSTYTGDCMQIERASDNTTQEIGFVADTCDRAAIASFCSGTTCWVNIWYDQSGNGRDAYGQNYGSTTDNLPIIYESGAVTTCNGKLAIKLTHPRAFVWTDTGTNMSDLISGGPANTDKKGTISIVGQIGSTSTQPYLWVSNNPGETEYWWFFESTTARIEFGTTASGLSSAFTRDAQKHWVGKVDGNTFAGFENSASLGSGVNASIQTFSSTQVTVLMGGGSFPSRNIYGFYQEVINWKTAEDVTTLWNSADHFWGIP